MLRHQLSELAKDSVEAYLSWFEQYALDREHKKKHKHKKDKEEKKEEKKEEEEDPLSELKMEPGPVVAPSALGVRPLLVFRLATYAGQVTAGLLFHFSFFFWFCCCCDLRVYITP